MDTLDAKTRIMNEIDSIDVQVQALQEKISELHTRKNQYKEAYSSIIAAEQQAERLLTGLLRPADVSETEMVADAENVWEASEEDAEGAVMAADESFDPPPMMDESESQADEEFEEEPEASEINGRRKIGRQVPSFLRQYL